VSLILSEARADSRPKPVVLGPFPDIRAKSAQQIALTVNAAVLIGVNQYWRPVSAGYADFAARRVGGPERRRRECPNRLATASFTSLVV
jgi:hypothetical protein